MNQVINLDVERLRASARANGEDATIWRWFSDGMEDRSLICECHHGQWIFSRNGEEIARDQSFDRAARLTYSTLRAMVALERAQV